MNIEDDSSASSTSSSSSNSSTTAKNPRSPTTTTNVPSVSHKRKAGRKKFKETRHPVYRGVRRKNGNKWVCEVREPNNKSRVWVGTFPTPKMAAMAHDVAVLALRGESAKLNFPDSARTLPRAKSSSARDIQMAALEATRASFRPTMPVSSTRLMAHVQQYCQESLLEPMVVKSEPLVPETSSSTEVYKGTGKVLDSSSTNMNMNMNMNMFVDEEALFNMPGLLDSMAEGLLLTPPAMKKGFDWDSVPNCDMDVTLWRD